VRSRYARVGRDPAVGQCILLAGNVGAEEGRHRRLNQNTRDEAAPLPRIQEVLRDFGTVQVYSSMDLKSGYWQIPMDPAFKHLTALATPDGATYQYRVMPFGLKNAPATFQKRMTRVLARLLGR
jgi:hypothetical protein